MYDNLCKIYAQVNICLKLPKLNPAFFLFTEMG